MKKWIKMLSILLMIMIILPGLIYLGLAIYYQDSFMYGTWINGIYCTGKNIEEVEKELTENFAYENIYVITPQDVEVIQTENLGTQYDFKSSLEEYRKKQNPFVWWMRMLTGHQNENVLPKVSFDESILEQWIYAMDSYQSNLYMKPDSLEIVMGENGYEILEKKEKILNISFTKEKLTDAINNLQTEVNLESEGCYFTREETVEMQRIRELYEKIEKIQSLSLTYQFKDRQKKVTPAEISLWIALDETGSMIPDKNGELSFDKNAITGFIEQLAAEYDTWENFPFVTHDGKEIVLKMGNYGTKINQQKEIAFLLDYLKNPMETIRTPVYSKDVTYQDRSSIDNTYVEVDMTLQKMFFFSEGEKKLETDVVTGCTAKGWETPEMVCYINYKRRNTYLTGKNYRSFVNYWVPVYRGIGLHDATWRDEFGGEIYKKGGSHGCINTPLEKMKELYDMLEVGMPVVIHY